MGIAQGPSLAVGEKAVLGEWKGPYGEEEKAQKRWLYPGFLLSLRIRT